MKRRSTHLSTIRNDHPAPLYAPETPERDRPRVTRCCAKCRRGVPGFGELPCGFNLACPNPKCLHAEHPEPKNFDHLNTPKENDR